MPPDHHNSNVPLSKDKISPKSWIDKNNRRIHLDTESKVSYKIKKYKTDEASLLNFKYLPVDITILNVPYSTTYLYQVIFKRRLRVSAQVTGSKTHVYAFTR